MAAARFRPCTRKLTYTEPFRAWNGTFREAKAAAKAGLRRETPMGTCLNFGRATHVSWSSGLPFVEFLASSMALSWSMTNQALSFDSSASISSNAGAQPAWPCFA